MSIDPPFPVQGLDTADTSSVSESQHSECMNIDAALLLFAQIVFPRSLSPQLSLSFQQKKALTDAGSPAVKGAVFTDLEMFQAIKCRNTISRLGQQRRWPQKIDWSDVRDRIFSMKDTIVDLFQSSNKLEACPMWDQFLLAIDYKNSTLRDQKVN
jgi:hypothetical protein